MKFGWQIQIVLVAVVAQCRASYLTDTCDAKVWVNRGKPTFVFNPSHVMLPYFKRCIDHTAWVYCMVDERTDKRNLEAKRVREWELNFPSELDMIIAGLIFCDLQYFLKVNNTEKCPKLPADVCRHKVDQQYLNDSCKIFASQALCRYHKLNYCDPSIDFIRYYELALLGGDCLEKENLYSQFITTFICAGATSVTVVTHHVILTAVVSLGTSLAWSQNRL